MHESYLMENYFRPSEDNIHNLHHISLYESEENEPNVRNCETVFFPIPSYKECGKLHVPVLGKFYLCVCICAFFCFLGEVSYTDSQIL